MEILREPRTEYELWFAVQGILGAMGVASNILQVKQKSPYREARERLRREAGINRESPMTNRELRDHFLHVDTKVETWVKGDRIGTVASFRTFAGMPLVANEVPGSNYFAHYDPKTTTVRFWDHDVALEAVEKEAKRILARLDDKRRIRDLVLGVPPDEVD